MKPQVCVIIPTYGHFDYARRAVESLGSAAAAVIIDDCSPDWHTVDWKSWPRLCRKVRFRTRGGLTRSWNAGLRIAREIGSEYAICTNSDVLFTQGWLPPLAAALNSGFHLVGPVTNAPGDAPCQDVRRCLAERTRLTDSRRSIDSVLKELGSRRRAPVAAKINGFFMMARTAQWWQGAFSSRAVFDPRFRMVGNEDELQERWSKAGLVTGFVPASYVFHYRSVSRPEGLMGRSGGGAYRLKPAVQLTTAVMRDGTVSSA